MNLLSIDTSSKVLSFSIAKNNQLIYEYNRFIDNGASLLIYKLANVLERLSIKIEDFDLFGVGSGPGSFTGLRVSFSIIKAFASVAKRPVFSQNSFFSCAYPFRKKAKKIAVISDARKNLIYAGFFRSDKKGFRQKSKVKLMKLEDCIKGKKEYLFLTYDTCLREKVREEKEGIRFYPADVYPRAKYLFNNISSKQVSDDVGKLKPLYLHPMNCQVRKKI